MIKEVAKLKEILIKDTRKCFAELELKVSLLVAAREKEMIEIKEENKKLKKDILELLEERENVRACCDHFGHYEEGATVE